jgi:hypothetical protein
MENRNGLVVEADADLPLSTCPYSKLRKPKKSWSLSAFRVLSRDKLAVASGNRV